MWPRLLAVLRRLFLPGMGYISPQRAAQLGIRQDMELHPVERGEHWRKQ